MRQHCLTLEGQTRRAGVTCKRHRQKTPAGGEGGPRMGSGPLLPVPSPLSLASSAPPHPLQAKETLCCFLPQEPGGN